jgi:hypothetical protein
LQLHATVSLLLARALMRPRALAGNAAQMAWSALLALPAWLAPYEGTARDAPSDATPLSLADDALGDAGLALWLAKRSRR